MRVRSHGEDIEFEGFLAIEMPEHSDSRVKIGEEASTQAWTRVNGNTRATWDRSLRSGHGHQVLVSALRADCSQQVTQRVEMECTARAVATVDTIFVVLEQIFLCCKPLMR